MHLHPCGCPLASCFSRILLQSFICNKTHFVLKIGRTLPGRWHGFPSTVGLCGMSRVNVRVGSHDVGISMTPFRVFTAVLLAMDCTNRRGSMLLFAAVSCRTAARSALEALAPAILPSVESCSGKDCSRILWAFASAQVHPGDLAAALAAHAAQDKVELSARSSATVLWALGRLLGITAPHRAVHAAAKVCPFSHTARCMIIYHAAVSYLKISECHKMLHMARQQHVSS